MKYIKATILFSLIFSCNLGSVEKKSLLGTPLPSVRILKVDSTTDISAASHIAKGPTVFFFFGPDCPFCKAELATILEKIDLLKNVRFYVLTVWSFNEMKNFSEKYQLSKYDNITTGVDCNLSMVNHFGTYGVPYTAIYGKDNRLKRSFSGQISADDIIKVINN